MVELHTYYVVLKVLCPKLLNDNPLTFNNLTLNLKEFSSSKPFKIERGSKVGKFVYLCTY